MDSSSSLKGIELAKLVLSSGLLHCSWSKILQLRASNHPNQDSSLGIKIRKQGKSTFVVFGAPPLTTNDSALTLLSRSQDQNPFSFLCSEKISEFYVHSCAFQIFSAAFNALFNLKSKLLGWLESKKSVIITGDGLGGSVASLFTLWLLETIDPQLPRPLCITFGSPLIGEAVLQQVLEDSVRNSCFLHVADATRTPLQAGLKPFGMFLICFDSECICIEDPEAVMELLSGVNADPVDYGDVLQRLDQSVLSVADSGLMIDDVIDRMKERAEKKKPSFDQSKKLNDMKIAMMYMEWYKKQRKKDKNGYYDQYRYEIPAAVNVKVEGWKKELNEYWKKWVEDVEKKPPSDMSRRFIFAGNNYRRMIEPLDIAEYYRQGKTEYSLKGRSPHYAKLERWFRLKCTEPSRGEGNDLSYLLTFDSCFWAEVEEAMIVINQMKSHEGMNDEISMQKLVKFEKYVWEMIVKREVSPEIFLEKSSFMKWWKEYEDIKKRHGFISSHFTEFMTSRNYETYGQPAKK